MITLLTGPNSYSISEAVRLKTKAFEGDVESFGGSELESKHLPDLFMGASLFSPNRLIVIKGAAANKTLWSDLEQWIERVPAETEIVFIEPSPDKRTKTYKLLQKHATIQEHGELNDPQLLSWLQAHSRTLGTELSPDAAKFLISYVGRDQWRLTSELQKVLLAGKPVTAQLIQDIAEPYPEATAFELLDAVFAGDETKVHRLLQLLREREDPYQFFGLLSSQVVGLLALVNAGARRPDEIAKDMALHPFVIRKLSTASHKLGKARVERLMERLAYADERIKTSGVDPWRQLEMTLGNI